MLLCLWDTSGTNNPDYSDCMVLRNVHVFYSLNENLHFPHKDVLGSILTLLLGIPLNGLML